MNAARPDCARVVTPIRAINKIIIGNMCNLQKQIVDHAKEIELLQKRIEKLEKKGKYKTLNLKK